MGPKDSKQQRPRIHLYFHSQVAEALVDSIAAGIEEEGVPYWREKREGGDAVAMAFTAAEESQLGVGIGLEVTGTLAIHFQRLEPQHPLFQVNIANEGQYGVARNLGSNAARLVKGTPFKPLEEEEIVTTAPPPSVPEPAREETVDPELVRRVVEALLGQGAAPRR